MIKKRLLTIVENSKKYIALNIMFQWISLIANVTLMGGIAILLGMLLTQEKSMSRTAMVWGTVIVCAVMVRLIATILASRMSYLSSKEVKKTLREKLFCKLLRLGTSYEEQVQTSEVVQVAVEGVDQLETYFGAYLPQLFYAMLAPLTLFFIICFINVPTAIVLFVCVPLIPVSIAVVQTWAKKLLARYWGQYTALGDTFLENLQGLTTLKIYQADTFKNEEMNRESEKFRKITMKVLTMQLNSITIMDLIAYGGAALGIIVAGCQFRAGNVSVTECLFMILLSADFFIPMRQLGSFFHIAMNGMAASDKIFRILDLTENRNQKLTIGDDTEIRCQAVHYSYDEEREILHGVDMTFPSGKFTAIVGESGCGKSTIAGILMGRNKGYTGTVTIGKHELRDIDEKSLLQKMTYIGHQSYLFKGTVRENLLAGMNQTENTGMEDQRMWDVLERVKLADFIRKEGGLDLLLQERASNLSGGQSQRLALARALLHDSEIYILDEATSNIDVNSENDIMEEVYELAKRKTIILISHRLANVVQADYIYVMENGTIAEQGTHQELLKADRETVYTNLWNTQQRLEEFGKEHRCYEKEK